MSLQAHKKALSALENPQQYYQYVMGMGGAYSCPVCGDPGMQTATQFYDEISRHLPVDCSCPISGCQRTVNEATFRSLFQHINDAHKPSGDNIPNATIEGIVQKERAVQEAYKKGLAEKIKKMEQGD